jgi:hypothetical protein
VIWGGIVWVEPLASLAPGAYALSGDGAGAITDFVVADVPVSALTAEAIGIVGPAEDGCGDEVRLSFDTNAVWLEVQVQTTDRFRGADDFGIVAAPDGLVLDGWCRWQGFEQDAFVRLRPHGADGTVGEWTDPVEISWSPRF